MKRDECPLCAREAPVTMRGTIGRHSSSDTRYAMCAGYGMTPDDALDLSRAVLTATVADPRFAMTADGIADLVSVSASTAWCALVGHEDRGDVVRRYEPYIVWHRPEIAGSAKGPGR